MNKIKFFVLLFVISSCASSKKHNFPELTQTDLNERFKEADFYVVEGEKRFSVTKNYDRYGLTGAYVGILAGAIPFVNSPPLELLGGMILGVAVIGYPTEWISKHYDEKEEEKLNSCFEDRYQEESLAKNLNSRLADQNASLIQSSKLKFKDLFELEEKIKKIQFKKRYNAIVIPHLHLSHYYRMTAEVILYDQKDKVFNVYYYGFTGGYSLDGKYLTKPVENSSCKNFKKVQSNSIKHLITNICDDLDLYCNKVKLSNDEKPQESYWKRFE